MPMHDWTRVYAGIYHAFHQGWIYEIASALNRGILPKTYYALPEQVTAGAVPDVLALHAPEGDAEEIPESNGGGVVTATQLQTRPQTRVTVNMEGGVFRRIQSAMAVRHVSDDRIVAMIEIVSPGNKSSQSALQTFVNKACDLLEQRIHLLIVDPFPPTPRDPNGIHNAIWGQFDAELTALPADQPLTLVAYECEQITRGYIEPLAVGQALPNMPLFLMPNGCVMVPLEATYQTAFAVMPRRWQTVLAPPAS